MCSGEPFQPGARSRRQAHFGLVAKDSREVHTLIPRSLHASLTWLLWLACFADLGCDRHELSEADCHAIVRRIVELELHERGFRDPYLVDRELRSFLTQGAASQLNKCVGQRAHADVMTCVREARSAEVLAHECLK